MGMILLLATISGCKKDDDKPEPTPKATDADGNVYNSVRIGEQIWMAENLRTTKYSDGTPIPEVTGNSEWASLTTPAFCWYANEKATYGSKYGALYNFYAVNTGNLCPVGWHIPSNEEFQQLADYLGGDAVAGSKLKDKDSLYWAGPDTLATNETGFSARPGGYRNENNGDFALMGTHGFWWSTKTHSTTNAWNWIVEKNQNNLHTLNHSRKRGYSVRCIKD